MGCCISKPAERQNLCANPELDKIRGDLLEWVKEGRAAADHPSFKHLTHDEQSRFYDMIPGFVAQEKWKDSYWMYKYNRLWDDVWEARHGPRLA
jgi:hypothetical protein